jgi:hypothetical protein
MSTQPVLPGLPEGGFLAPRLPRAPRPTEKTPEVVSAALDVLFPKVLAWLKEPGIDKDLHNGETEQAQIRKELKSGMFKGFDGYQFCRHLEKQHYWDGLNSDLVDILERSFVYEDDALRVATKKWVTAYGVTTEFKVGDTVIANTKFHRRRRGVILNLDSEMLTARVKLLKYDHSIPILVACEDMQPNDGQTDVD